MAKKRARLGYRITYFVELYVAHPDEHKAIVACQQFVQGEPQLDESYPTPRFCGYRRSSVRPIIERPPCRRCTGAGTVDGEPCPRCLGRGKEW